MALKDMKTDLNKMKDEVYLLTHQLEDIDKFRKIINLLENKIDKIKVDSE